MLNFTSIKRIHGRQILDSRGTPTLEVEVALEDGSRGRASVPSGASVGTHEAVERRDGGPAFGGKGVLRAVESINQEIQEALLGRDASSQAHIDHCLIELDGTPNKHRLGANALLAVSLATARAAASSYDMPLYRYLGGAQVRTLPTPLINVLNGGLHADTGLQIQEVMMVPAGAESFSQALQMGAEIFQHLKALLKEKSLSTNVGDEGGFAPQISSVEQALDLLLEAVARSPYKPGNQIWFALDVAATGLYEKGMYRLDNKKYTSDELVEYYKKLTENYPLFSIEDGMAEDDWDGWHALSTELGEKTQLVGDDLFVTNLQRIQKGLEWGAANAVLIKPNQIGTLTETYEAVHFSHTHGLKTVMSHRSGETEDSIIADLAVAYSTQQIKAGSLSRSDRVAKYNQLLRIEEEMGSCAVYSGKSLISTMPKA